MSNSFAQRLKQVLGERNMQQKDLAAKINITPASVSKWMQGGSVDSTNLTNICNALDVSADYLLGRTTSQRIVDDPRRVVEDHTGLSEAAIIQLHNGLFDSLNPNRRKVLSDLISNDLFLQIIDAIAMYCSVISTQTESYNATLKAIQADLQNVANDDPSSSFELEKWVTGMPNPADPSMPSPKKLSKRGERDLALFSCTNLITESIKQLARNELLYFGEQNLVVALNQFDENLSIAAEHDYYEVKEYAEKNEEPICDQKEWIDKEYPRMFALHDRIQQIKDNETSTLLKSNIKERTNK